MKPEEPSALRVFSNSFYIIDLNLMKRLLFGILMVSLTTLVWAQDSQRINAKKFSAIINTHTDVLILDVRPSEKFALFRIKDAIPLPTKAQLIDLANDLPKQDTILVYCGKELRSTPAVQLLDSLGFKCVYELKGGLISWRRNGLPLDETKL